jgi:hypothetical protein
MSAGGEDAARTAGLHPSDEDLSPGTPAWRPALLAAHYERDGSVGVGRASRSASMVTGRLRVLR